METTRVPSLKPKVAIDLAANRADNRNLFANGFDIFEFILNRFARALAAGLHAGLPRPDDDHVVAHVHEGVHHASTQPLTISQQQHHRSQAPHNAQHGERGAHAVAHERLPALRDEFFQEHRNQGLGARG
jgi:hypothetical protein